jgi:hypothetical protein
MDGIFYTCENFDFFRDMMKVKFPLGNKYSKVEIVHTKPFDVYSNFKDVYVVITETSPRGILIVPKSEDFNFEELKSKLEKITRTKLEEFKNGN